MNSARLLRPSLLVCGTLLLALSGCASSPTPRFYLLQSLGAPTAGAAAATETTSSVAIGIAPVKLPEYVERPQIVTRPGSNELKLAEFDRWAEPLAQNVTRILAENLAALLATDRVAMFPWTRATPVDYRIAVDVSQFDGTLGGKASLSARWTISSGDGKTELMVRKSTLSEQTDGADYAALVATESRALAALSRDIAAAVRSLTSAADHR
jgi:uncharacterized lipoprotein YmbA